MLSSLERSKLFDNIQKSFPLSQKWKELRAKHTDRVSFGALTVVSAIALSLPPLAWWLGSLGLGSSLSIGAGFFALLGSVICWSGFAAGGIVVVNELWGHWIVSKEFKSSQSQQAARDYIQEKRTAQYVQHKIPSLSDEELELLLQYPHTQKVYKNLIKKEQEKRKQIQTAEQIKQSFTVSVDQPVTQLEENVVAVQTPRSLNL